MLVRSIPTFFERVQQLHSSFKNGFSTEEFRVNMHDQSISCMNAIMGNHIGSMIRVVKDYNVNEDGSRWGITLRVLIEMKLKKPISRGRFLNVEGCKC